METTRNNFELIVDGLNLTRERLIEEKIRNNQKIAISENGIVKLIDPKTLKKKQIKENI